MTSFRQTAQPGTFKKISAHVAIVAAFALALASCAPRYEYRAIPVRPISGYPGQAQVGGALIGAVAFYSAEELTQLFGFDLKKAGVVPVQVMVHNTSSSPITFLDGARITAVDGKIWEVLPSDVVYRNINDYTAGSLDGEKGVRRTLMWGLAGAMLGAAVGVASGTNVGEAAGTGAVIGGAAGAASSVVGAGTTTDTSQDVIRDFSSRSLEHRTIAPGEEASGFLYFPAQSAQPSGLSMNFDVGGTRQNVTMNL
ncbi:MAG: hypothetical protein LBT40_14815 [Deltaproteobacteria bacterium]|jgi:hypothetical protein|nr:hypothetical protein [Deltaproteobacteria bacterium]